MQNSVIAYPRIGALRELKFAIEKYFKKESSTLKKDQKLTLGKVCPNCHYVVPTNEHYCYNCGLDFTRHARCAIIDAGRHSFPTNRITQICPKCKRKISYMNRYCNYCGYKIEN